MKIIYRTATLFTGVILGILVSLIATKLLENHLLDRQMKLSALDEPFAGLQKNEGETQEDKIASAILIDSIFTILQNYYVDDFRSSDNRYLIKGALAELDKFRSVRVEYLDEKNVRVQMVKHVTEGLFFTDLDTGEQN